MSLPTSLFLKVFAAGAAWTALACGAPGKPAAEPADAAAPDADASLAEGPPERPVYGVFAVWATTEEPPGEPRKDIVRRIVRENLVRVRLCYSVSLRQHPGLRGRVAARFEIAPDGRVGEVAVESELAAAPEVGPCVADVVRALKFPPLSSEAVIVNYSFALEP